ncbi:DUF3500 domain-containing protein [Mangrovihabitans endophyticus]|uniref:DUF3500 domain-containing protein n=1 Tax=Mangrovihabitans endophyticus TaxID=1751298 RepID=A0A8J3FQT9_9ACTN|nr:DUF3500 domain-containing protein [Mangrovihabitans endophyticus]GGL03678.1 hypothetical protein GCM10012284_42830 [Mangrovihabitans endophyticus]
MHTEATAFLAALTGAQRAEAARAFDDEAARRWIEYRPRPRPGLSLAALGETARKAAHRLLATGLSESAYAQAMTVIALEEVLDRREGWQRGRHSEDYRVVVFGEPGDDRWAWRFEGHHLSVTMTVVDQVIAPAPVFLGANPARVDVAGRPAVRPLGVEEDLGRELLAAMTPATRGRAVVAALAPPDVRTGTRPVAALQEPRGVPRQDLRPGERDLLDRLVGAHLGRLPAPLVPPARDLHFAWEGASGPGAPHYYRIQGDDLIIEFDNTTADGNHAHSVLRRPCGDFGGDILAAHHATAAHP